MLDAIIRYLREEEGEDITIGEDGTVRLKEGRRTQTYPHPLACVEAIYKSSYEWQIRELPEQAWVEDCTNVFCGEMEGDVEMDSKVCLEKLRERLPGKRPRAFVWYLKQGSLVTFFRKKSRVEIVVLGRYLLMPGHVVTEWTGRYEDIVEDLWGPTPIISGFDL